jgi:hypothetical protein
MDDSVDYMSSSHSSKRLDSDSLKSSLLNLSCRRSSSSSSCSPSPAQLSGSPSPAQLSRSPSLAWLSHSPSPTRLSHSPSPARPSPVADLQFGRCVTTTSPRLSPLDQSSVPAVPPCQEVVSVPIPRPNPRYNPA